MNLELWTKEGNRLPNPNQPPFIYLKHTDYNSKGYCDVNAGHHSPRFCYYHHHFSFFLTHGSPLVGITQSP